MLIGAQRKNLVTFRLHGSARSFDLMNCNIVKTLQDRWYVKSSPLFHLQQHLPLCQKKHFRPPPGAPGPPSAQCTSVPPLWFTTVTAINSDLNHQTKLLSQKYSKYELVHRLKGGVTVQIRAFIRWLKQLCSLMSSLVPSRYWSCLQDWREKVVFSQLQEDYFLQSPCA